MALIEFAPIHIPLERRLQTAAAFAWILTLILGSTVLTWIVALLTIFTPLRWLILPYLGWAWGDRDISEGEGRRLECVRSWIWWKYFRDYFPLRFEKIPGVELDPKKNYLFCCFPHGLLSTGAFNAFGTNYGGFREWFPYHKSHLCILRQHFNIPFFRDFILGLGCRSASTTALNYILSKPEGGNVAVLMVGGAAEAYNCRPGPYKVILKNRKGFIKVALKNGSPLVPVISFGENSLFTQLGQENSVFRKIQECLRKYVGITPIIPLGRGVFQYSLGIVPHRNPVTTVVGPPIPVEKVEYPTDDQIEKLHETFCKNLTDLFESQKATYFKDSDKMYLEIS